MTDNDTSETRRETPDPETDTTTTDGIDLDPDERRRIVRERYATIATDDAGCCGTRVDGTGAGSETADTSGCCDEDATDGRSLEAITETIGYEPDRATNVPDGANMGLGCGNPNAIAALEEGETVLDLGSGGGFDCFLAADAVGESGRVIGVDMTPEMIERARENARAYETVEFRLGEIEHLPVAGETVDVVISNCVVNLSPDKPQVFRDAYRVLRPGGRLAISDVVQTAAFPADVRNDPDSLAGRVAGASTIDALETMLADAGFEDVRIDPNEESESFIREWDDERDLSEYIVSATIEARKPEIVNP